MNFKKLILPGLLLVTVFSSSVNAIVGDIVRGTTETAADVVEGAGDVVADVISPSHRYYGDGYYRGYYPRRGYYRDRYYNDIYVD